MLITQKLKPLVWNMRAHVKRLAEAVARQGAEANGCGPAGGREQATAQLKLTAMALRSSLLATRAWA